MKSLPSLSLDEPDDPDVVETIARPVRPLWRAVIEVLLALAIASGLARLLVADLVVGDDGMRPAIVPDQQILVSRLSYYLTPPQRGDLVAVVIPSNPGRLAARRIVGLPGEKVELRGAQILIDGQSVIESYLPSAGIGSGSPVSISVEVNLRPDQYFVMSDNRSFFVDSRVWGAVSAGAIVGRVWFSYWPAERLGFIRRERAAAGP